MDDGSTMFLQSPLPGISRGRHWFLTVVLFIWTFIGTVRSDDGSTHISERNNKDKDAKDQIDRAIRICREKLAKEPGFPKASFSLAELLESRHGNDLLKLEEIANLYEQAGRPSDGGLSDAIRIESLRKCGQRFDAIGATDRSFRCFESALLLIDTNDNSQILTETLKEASHVVIETTIDDSSSSERIGRLLTDLEGRHPVSPIVRQLRGAWHRAHGRSSDAYLAYDLATTLPHGDNNDILLANSLILASAAAREAGLHVDVQLEYLQRAIKLDLDAATQADVYNNIGITHKRNGKKQAAIQYFRLAQEVQAGDSHAAVHLASMNADTSDVSGMDPSYVAGLFDGYSSRFEQELLEDLGYTGHEMVVDAILAFDEANLRQGMKYPREQLVDLGCGTGLTGELLRSKYNDASVVGVDLSKRMAHMARSRMMKEGNGELVYSDVQQMDAVLFLKGLQDASVDAILASDVFIYIGDLESIFQEAERVLVDGGLLIFTVESTTEGMKLLPSGRFGHSKDYIERLASTSKFGLIHTWTEGTLRMQGGVAVDGAAVTLQSGGEQLRQRRQRYHRLSVLKKDS